MIKCSVIIPTLNRSQLLKKAIESLINQTTPLLFFEVIVVDNGSNDDTKDVCSNLSNNFPHFSYFYDSRPGLHTGRNRGFLESKSEILIYADDDIIASPTWIEGILEAFQDPTVALVGGNNIPLYESQPPSWITKLWYNSSSKDTMGPINSILYLSVAYFGEQDKQISPYQVYGCNFSVRKNIIKECNGFHPDGMPKKLLKFRGDGETYISHYIHKNNLKTFFSSKATIHHFVSENRMKLIYATEVGFRTAISLSYTQYRNHTILKALAINIFLILKTLSGAKKSYGIASKYFMLGFLKGLIFHSKEVWCNNEVRDWVKKKDYIN